MEAFHLRNEFLPVSLLENIISSTTGAFVLTATFLFFQMLFKYDFLCPCDPDFAKHVGYCVQYMVLPAFIFFFICLLMDRQRGKICGCTREDTPWPLTTSFSLKYCKVFLKAICMGMFWVIITFMNGDWYVCLKTHSNGTAEEQLACKKEKDMTNDEKHEVTNYTNESRSIGFGCILAVIILWVAVSCRCKPYRDHLLDEELEKEDEAYLEQQIIAEARGRTRGEPTMSGRCIMM